MPRPDPRRRSRCRARCSSVYDTPDDTTRPVPREVRRGTSRGSCRPSTPTAAGRRAPSASASTTPTAEVVVVTMADGSDDPEQIDDLAPPRRAGRRGRRRVALHARAGSRSAARRSRRLLSRAGRPVAATGSRGSARATRPTRSRPTRPTFVARGRHRVRRRLRDRHRAGRQGAPPPAAGRRDPDDLARRADRACRTSRSPTWIPRYLRWYRFAFGPELDAATSFARSAMTTVVTRARSWSPGRPASSAATSSRSCSAGATRSSASTTTRSTGGSSQVLRRPPALPAGRGRRARRRPDDASCSTDCDHFIAGAAMIGGISYFHAYAYDLLATNERIIAASCDAAIARAPRRDACRRSRT